MYGLGLIMSRFGPNGPMPDFRDGPFRLALHSYGVYALNGEDIDPPCSLPRAAMLGDRSSENSGRTKNSPLSLVLGPLIKLVFSEKARRRKRCRELLKERYGIGEFGARFGKGRRMKAARLGAGWPRCGGGAGARQGRGRGGADPAASRAVRADIESRGAGARRQRGEAAPADEVSDVG